MRVYNSNLFYNFRTTAESYFNSFNKIFTFKRVATFCAALFAAGLLLQYFTPEPKLDPDIRKLRQICKRYNIPLSNKDKQSKKSLKCKLVEILDKRTTELNNKFENQRHESLHKAVEKALKAQPKHLFLIAGSDHLEKDQNGNIASYIDAKGDKKCLLKLLQNSKYVILKVTDDQDSNKIFKVIHRNCEPEKAQIICMGECHVNKTHCERIGELINQLWEQGDIVLTENSLPLQSGTENTPLKFVKKKFTSQSWDINKTKQPEFNNLFECIGAVYNVIIKKDPMGKNIGQLFLKIIKAEV